MAANALAKLSAPPRWYIILSIFMTSFWNQRIDAMRQVVWTYNIQRPIPNDDAYEFGARQ